MFLKVKKMAGQMGAVQRTVQNLQVLRVLADEGLIYVKGGIPSSENSWVKIRDSIKGTKVKDLPYPASVEPVKKKSEKQKDQDQKSAEK